MFLFEPVIPGCALLRADPESSSGLHISGFRVRASKSAVADLDNILPNSGSVARPGMTAFSLKAREFTQLSADGASMRRAIAQFDGLLRGCCNRKMP